nr:unnamed protein product [Callosobruchus analis]
MILDTIKVKKRSIQFLHHLEDNDKKKVWRKRLEVDLTTFIALRGSHLKALFFEGKKAECYEQSVFCRYCSFECGVSF